MLLLTKPAPSAATFPHHSTLSNSHFYFVPSLSTSTIYRHNTTLVYTTRLSFSLCFISRNQHHLPPQDHTTLHYATLIFTLFHLTQPVALLPQYHTTLHYATLISTLFNLTQPAPYTAYHTSPHNATLLYTLFYFTQPAPSTAAIPHNSKQHSSPFHFVSSHSTGTFYRCHTTLHHTTPHYPTLLSTLFHLTQPAPSPNTISNYSTLRNSHFLIIPSRPTSTIYRQNTTLLYTTQLSFLLRSSLTQPAPSTATIPHYSAIRNSLFYFVLSLSTSTIYRRNTTLLYTTQPSFPLCSISLNQHHLPTQYQTTLHYAILISSSFHLARPVPTTATTPHYFALHNSYYHFVPSHATSTIYHHNTTLLYSMQISFPPPSNRIISTIYCHNNILLHLSFSPPILPKPATSKQQ